MIDNQVTGLPGAEEAGKRLRATALRDFGPPIPFEERKGKRYKQPLEYRDTPVPHLIRFALNLIGLEAHGPGEKVAWWVDFSFRGEPCEIAHEKFGVRIYLGTEAGEEAAAKTITLIQKQISSAMRTVEKVVLAAAPTLLGEGDATVKNQHTQLRRAYEYFRARAEDPAVIEDVVTEIPASPDSIIGTGTSYMFGDIQMSLNAFHDLVAAISAYVSLLEHDLVLALPFVGFDPSTDDLTTIIGSRWGEKFSRVLGGNDDVNKFRGRLGEVVERWRNPYSHGGFEKGHGATIYLHVPGVGAVPVGMTSVRDSPHFSFIPAKEDDIAEVFALFDEVDAWLKTAIPYAFEWIESALPVRFDSGFRAEIELAKTGPDLFKEFLDHHGFMHDRAVNMDF